MLLAIDAGNTNIVFAAFEDGKQVGLWRCATEARRTADEYVVYLDRWFAQADLDPTALKGAIIASVVPDATFHLKALCRDYLGVTPMMIGDPSLDLGVKALVDRPEEVGADRLVNAVAGLALAKPPLIIIDFGTATTFDVVDADGNFRGGAIAPGVNLSLNALHNAAAKLPRVAVAKPAKAIGSNTIEAMQSGMFWGQVSTIEGMVARMKTELGQEATVILTGGLAGLFTGSSSVIDAIDPDLTLRGLYLIYERNQRKHQAS